MKTMDEIGKQVAPARKQRLLDHVLDGTRRKGRRILLLVLWQIFSEPGHWPDRNGAATDRRHRECRNPASRTRSPRSEPETKQTVQRRGEHGPLHREFEAAFPQADQRSPDRCRVAATGRPKSSGPPMRRASYRANITVVDGIPGPWPPFREPSDRGGQAIEILAGEKPFPCVRDCG